MPEPGKDAGLVHAWLVRIEFPWVQVEDEGFPLFLIDDSESITAEPVGEQAEVAASGYGNGTAKKASGGDGVFQQAVWVLIGETRCAGHAIDVVADGEDGGIVGEAKFHEDIQRPEGLGGDGIAGSAIAKHGLAGDVFQDGFNLAGVFPEGLRGQVIDFTVPVTVAADGVALVVDGLHQLGEPVRDPADDEKGGLGVVPGQQFEDLFGVAHHPLFHGVPVARVDDVLEGGHLEVVFHVDGEVVGDWLHGRSVRERTVKGQMEKVGAGDCFAALAMTGRELPLRLQEIASLCSQ